MGLGLISTAPATEIACHTTSSGAKGPDRPICSSSNDMWTCGNDYKSVSIYHVERTLRSAPCWRRPTCCRSMGRAASSGAPKKWTKRTRRASSSWPRRWNIGYGPSEDLLKSRRFRGVFGRFRLVSGVDRAVLSVSER